MKRSYYLAFPNGKSAEAIKTWQEMTKNARGAAKKLMVEVGATAAYRRGVKIVALEFNADPGRAWRAVGGYGRDCYCPDRRTRLGKMMGKRLDDITIPDVFTFARLLGTGAILSGTEVGLPAFETIGDFLVISIPVSTRRGDGFVPPDATLLKMSEYYGMKEAVKAP